MTESSSSCAQVKVEKSIFWSHLFFSVLLPVLVDQRHLAINDEEEPRNDHGRKYGLICRQDGFLFGNRLSPVPLPLLHSQLHSAIGGGARQHQLRTSHGGKYGLL